MNESTGAAAEAGKRAAPRPPRLDPLAVRRQLREEGLRAHHALSQNFLADPDVLQSILDLADPTPAAHILEIGPGLGILTGGLLEAGASVVAVELDRRLAGRLDRTQAEAVQTGRLRIVQGDILDQEIASLIEPPYEVVANVPYHITSPILHRFLGAPWSPERLVLMLQREVAERIAAPPGDMSYLSVFVQYHANVRIAFVVPREAFEPPPEVESAVVEIRPRVAAGAVGAAGTAGTAGTVDAAGTVEAAGTVGVARAAPDAAVADAAAEEELWRLVQAGFRERRKKLKNVISRQLPISGDAVGRALEAAGIDGDRRPQTLSVAEWLDLSRAIGPIPGGRAAHEGRETRR